MKKLQIKDAGAWRNVTSFTGNEQFQVLLAAQDLLRSLQQAKTVMRVVDGETTLLFCSAPDFLWTHPQGGSLAAPG